VSNTPDTTTALFRHPLAESVAASAIVQADPTSVREAGLRWPVYFTRAAWDRHVAVTPAAAQMLCDERGRLWDALVMFAWAARRFDGRALRFTMSCVVDRPRTQRCTLVAFVVEQSGAPFVLITTAPEAMGEEIGRAYDMYDSLLSEERDADENDDDRGDHFA
jgi:hypothetical protein